MTFHQIIKNDLHDNSISIDPLSMDPNQILPQKLAATEAPNLSVVLTIRLLMQGKEVGSIIGKKGDHIKIIRDESGAKINISDGSCPERIVTITGNSDTINKAFTMICRKFEEDMQQLPNSVPKPPITLRLIVPVTQCGSLIGKGGSKIKEIREATGASIQVASEVLPNSTERAVTISGSADAIIQCMVQICQIMLESPPKGATIPYRPKPSFNPLLLASTAAAAAAAQQPLVQQAAYGHLSNSELTKNFPLNSLLQPVPQGFNPAVLASSGYTTTTFLPPVTSQQFSQLSHADMMSMAGDLSRASAAKSANEISMPDMSRLADYNLLASFGVPRGLLLGGLGYASPYQTQLQPGGIYHHQAALKLVGAGRLNTEPSGFDSPNPTPKALGANRFAPY